MSDFIYRKIIKARKQYSCSAFRRVGDSWQRCKIRKGTHYVKVAQRFDGVFQCDKLCLFHCAAIDAAFETEPHLCLEDGIDYTSISEWWTEWIDSSPENWIKCLAATRRELRNLKEGGA